MSETLKQLSRLPFTVDGTYDIEHVKTGCMQRIADATEVMATNYKKLIDERDNYKMLFKDFQETVLARDRSITAYKSKLTRKKRLVQSLTNELQQWKNNAKQYQ